MVGRRGPGGAGLNYLRLAIVLLAWIAALTAFSLSSERRA